MLKYKGIKNILKIKIVPIINGTNSFFYTLNQLYIFVLNLFLQFYLPILILLFLNIKLIFF